jgi:hypothetical protein
MSSTATVADSQAPSRRRWLRFRLRTLLLIQLLAAIPCAWVAFEFQSLRNERNAAAEIEAFGGTLTYQLKIGPDWLRHAFGRRLPGYFETPTSIGFDGKTVTPETLKPLARIRRIESLSFINCFFRDDALAAFERTPHVKFLLLRGANVGNDELQHIRGLAQLEVVDLGYTHVTDAGLSCFEGKQFLNTLHLRHTKILGPGLVHLRGLPRLKDISAAWSSIGDDGLEHLSTLPALIGIELGTNVTDAGLAKIGELTRLQGLSLDGSQVADAGLEHVRQLKNLTSLALCGT